MTAGIIFLNFKLIPLKNVLFVESGKKSQISRGKNCVDKTYIWRICNSDSVRYGSFSVFFSNKFVEGVFICRRN